MAVDGGRFHTCAILGNGGVKVSESLTCFGGVTFPRWLERRGVASNVAYELYRTNFILRFLSDGLDNLKQTVLGR